MSFGNKKKRELAEKKPFNPYDHCKVKWGLTRSDIVEITKKRTYKKFVEYTVKWKNVNGEGEIVFKTILTNLELEDF